MESLAVGFVLHPFFTHHFIIRHLNFSLFFTVIIHHSHPSFFIAITPSFVSSSLSPHHFTIIWSSILAHHSSCISPIISAAIYVIISLTIILTNPLQVNFISRFILSVHQFIHHLHFQHIIIFVRSSLNYARRPPIEKHHECPNLSTVLPAKIWGHYIYIIYYIKNVAVQGQGVFACNSPAVMTDLTVRKKMLRQASISSFPDPALISVVHHTYSSDPSFLAMILLQPFPADLAPFLLSCCVVGKVYDAQSDSYDLRLVFTECSTFAEISDWSIWASSLKAFPNASPDSNLWTAMMHMTRPLLSKCWGQCYMVPMAVGCAATAMGGPAAAAVARGVVVGTATAACTTSGRYSAKCWYCGDYVEYTRYSKEDSKEANK